MAALYHSLFTEKGLELLRESIQNGTKLGITHMSFGDGGGNLPIPDASFTQMVNEVYRVQLNRLAPSKENPNWLEADGVIPSAVGGFNIREVGLWAGGVMVAYANYPPTYKPSGDQGTAQIKTIRIVLQIDNTANFELKIDSSIVMATIQAVEDAKNELYKNTIAKVEKLSDLNQLEKWDGRTVYVKDIANFKYDQLQAQWILAGNTAGSVFDENGQNQQQINNARILTFEDFPTVSDALDFVKEDINNYVYAKAGKIYTLPQGEVFFNRIICLSGSATIRVLNGTNLNYLSKVDGTEIVCLKNLDILIEGHRADVNNSVSQVYTTSWSNTVKSLTLENLKVYGLKSINDLSSWQDDVGKSRCQGFISVKVSEFSSIKNIEHYGFGAFVSLDTSSPKAIHTEENVTGYNNETNIFIIERIWKSGSSKNINIINTAIQRDYWIKQNATVPVGRNGKNCVMCEADHTDSYVVENITAKCAIEKSVYNTSTNSVTRNTLDDNCFSMTTIKSPKQAGIPKSSVDGFNLKCIDPINTIGVQDTYGWKNATIERVSIEQSIKSVTKPFIFSDLGDLTYKNITAKNTGVPLYFGDGNNINSVSVIGADFIDCYDFNFSTLYFKATGTKTVKNLNLVNVRHYSNNLVNVAATELPGVGVALDGVVNFKASNSSWFSKLSPFSKGNETTYIEILNCNFTLKNSTLISTMWDNLKNTGTYGPQANIFDFSIDFVTTFNAVPQPKVKAYFKKINNSGIVLCSDHWSQIDIDYIVSTPEGVSLLTIGDQSFELSARFNDKMLKFYWDSVSKTIIPIVNFGSIFATSLTSEKINIFVDNLNRLVINIGNGSWSGGNGNLFIKVIR